VIHDQTSPHVFTPILYFIQGVAVGVADGNGVKVGVGVRDGCSVTVAIIASKSNGFSVPIGLGIYGF
jgi:hypothetical protein